MVATKHRAAALCLIALRQSSDILQSCDYIKITTKRRVVALHLTALMTSSHRLHNCVQSRRFASFALTVHLLGVAQETVVVCIGAGEDVEGVLVRLNAQSAENALLRERQAKANSDLQVRRFTFGLYACNWRVTSAVTVH